jgi:hypothetical protein
MLRASLERLRSSEDILIVPWRGFLPVLMRYRDQRRPGACMISTDAVPERLSGLSGSTDL